MSGTKRWALVCGVICVFGASVTALGMRYGTPSPPLTPSLAGAYSDDQVITLTLPVRRGDTLEVLLGRAGIENPARYELITAVRDAFDVRKFRAGTELVVNRALTGELDSVEYTVSPDEKLEVVPSDEGFLAQLVEIPGAIHAVRVCGTLEGSLFESMSRIGERPELAIAMAEIFAWDIDFYRDPRAGDEFCMLVEKKEYHNGQPPTYRRVLAARYNNAGTVFDGYMYQGPDDDKPYYYAYDGTSLQSAFLRSPLKFEARVSSHFSTRRLHPVYNTYQPHYGTDYAAPTGTNVYAVATGHVIFAARSGGSGNLVKIRHASGYVTMYLHLSRILVKVGQQVVQGERVGLVGMTGTATGPHLDFRIQRNGGYLNWENLRLPRVSRISDEQMESYAFTRDDYLAQMSPGFPSSQRLAVSDSPAQDSATSP